MLLTVNETRTSHPPPWSHHRRQCGWLWWPFSQRVLVDIRSTMWQSCYLLISSEGQDWPSGTCDGLPPTPFSLGLSNHGLLLVNTEPLCKSGKGAPFPRCTKPGGRVCNLAKRGGAGFQHLLVPSTFCPVRGTFIQRDPVLPLDPAVPRALAPGRP